MAREYNAKQRKEVKPHLLPGVRLQKDYKLFEDKTMDFILRAMKSH